MFHAFVEDYQFEPDGSDATLLRWTIAYKPRLAFKLATPVLPRALKLLLTRAGHNLDPRYFHHFQGLSQWPGGTPVHWPTCPGDGTKCPGGGTTSHQPHQHQSSACA